MKQICKNCRFFHSLAFEDNENNPGLCKRYPPKLYLVKRSLQSSLNNDVFFKYDRLTPEVLEFETCGEWKKRKKINKRAQEVPLKR